MTSPFDKHRESSGPSGGGDGPMRPGDTRTIHAKDKATGEIIKTITVHRTNRPYVEDLCDAYNAAMDEGAKRRGLAWYVTNAGELKLGDHEAFTRWNTKRMKAEAERQRQEWIRNQSRPLDTVSPTDESREPERQD